MRTCGRGSGSAAAYTAVSVLAGPGDGEARRPQPGIRRRQGAVFIQALNPDTGQPLTAVRLTPPPPNPSALTCLRALPRARPRSYFRARMPS